MRAAGRALALDPKSTDAARLVTMLMLEPAREDPPELVARFAELDNAIARNEVRTIGKTFAAFLLFLPFLVFVRAANWPLLAGLYAIAIAMMSVTIDRVYAFWSRHLVAAVGMTCLYLILVSRVFGTFILGPSLIATSALGVISYVGYTDHKRKIFAAILVTFLLPLGLEAVGAITPSWDIAGNAIVSYPQVAELDRVPMIALLVGTNVAMIVATCLIAHRLAASRRDALHRVEAQAWRLRQLLPT
jgi:hypothetical protein